MFLGKGPPLYHHYLLMPLGVENECNVTTDTSKETLWPPQTHTVDVPQETLQAADVHNVHVQPSRPRKKSNLHMFTQQWNGVWGEETVQHCSAALQPSNITSLGLLPLAQCIHHSGFIRSQLQACTYAHVHVHVVSNLYFYALRTCPLNSYHITQTRNRETIWGCWHISSSTSGSQP